MTTNGTASNPDPGQPADVAAALEGSNGNTATSAHRLHPESAFGAVVDALLSRLAAGAGDRAFERWREARPPDGIQPPEEWEPFLDGHDPSEVMFAVETAHGLLARLSLARAADDAGATDGSFYGPLERRAAADEIETTGYVTDLDATFKALAEGVAGNLYSDQTYDWWQSATAGDEALGTAVGRLWLSVAASEMDLGTGDPLGDLYGELFGRRTRRAFGEFYTPPDVVEFVLDRAGCDAPSGDRVIDPACGSGAFLVAVARRHLADERTPEAVERLFDEPWLVGLDIRPLAVLLARVRLAAAVLPEVAVGANIERLPVFRADTLLSERVEESRADGGQLTLGGAVGERVRVEGLSGETTSVPRPRDADDYYATVAESVADDDDGSEAALAHAIKQLDYDYVVGNPPYVNIKNIDGERKDAYQEAYDTAYYRFDLYVLFVERALELLREGGRLGYIVPNKFTRSQYGEKLRALLADDHGVDSYAELGNVFGDATTFACVIAVTKGEPGGPVDYAKTRDEAAPDLERIEDALLAEDEVLGEVEASAYPQSELGGAKWRFVPREARRIAGRLHETAATTVGDVAIGVRNGVSSGCDEAYIVTEEEAEQAELDDALLRPIVRGENVRRWTVDWSGGLAIYPYDKDGHVDVGEYPNVEAHLEAHRDELEGRYCTRTGKKSIFEYDGARTRSVFEGEFKIAVPDIATENNFAHPSGHDCFKNTAYVLTFDDDQPYSREMLLGMLNSTPVEFLLKQTSPPLQGDQKRYRYKTEYIDPLPLPEPDSKVERLVERVLAAERGETDESVTELEAAIDDRICELYGLDSDDRAAIDRFIDLF